MPVFRQVSGFGEAFTQPGSALARLVTGGGLGPCMQDPVTGFGCVLSPSLGFSFDKGYTGQLLLIR